MASSQDNENNRPRRKNPMNLTINTLQPPQNNRFPLSSPITDEISSPEHSSSAESGGGGDLSSSRKRKKEEPKLVNPGPGGNAAGDIVGESGLNLHAGSALSKTEFERALYARLLEQETRRDMATTSSQQAGDDGVVKKFYQAQQQRLGGLQLMTDFSGDEVQSEKGTFLDLSDLKSIANAREKERLREHGSLQSLQQPPQARTSELSPSDRPIMIGLTVPYNESAPRAAPATTGDTIDSASSRTPATPSIVVTPAKEHPPWHMDMHMDMSTSPEMLHRPRAASSIYSQPSPKPMYDEDAPPVPAIPAFHSVTSFQHHQRPVSTGTEFEGDDDYVATKEKEWSPTEPNTTSRKNMKKKLLHKLSVNTSDANRPDSQGWWTYLLSPLLSRSNTVSSRRTALSPQQHQARSARSPLSAVSFSKTLSPPQPNTTTTTTATEEGESSVNWWDDEKQVVVAVPPEKSHFSSDTPEDLTRHVPPIAWDMPFSDNHITTTTTTTTTTTRAVDEAERENARSVFQTGYANEDLLSGTRAEYYQASAHDQYDKENPYFECINHVCSMTSAAKRAEIEAAEREAEEKMKADAENEKRGLAVFVFDPSRDPENPFIAFLETRGGVKEVAVDGDAQLEKGGEEDGEKREVVGDEGEKTALSNARELLSFDSSDESEDDKDVDEKGYTSSRGLRGSTDLPAPTSRSVASFSPPARSRYEPSVSLPPPVEESRGIAPPPPAPAPPSVSYSRGMSPPPAPASAPMPAPAPAPAPVAASPAPAPIQMPMMPPPQPRAFSPEPVPMPMPPPPQPRAFSPEPVAMPMPPPVPVPAPLREPVPMPMSVSRSPPMNERAPVAMPSPPQPPVNDASRGHGIPSGYQWEPAPVPRALSPPRPARVASPPAAPASISQAREVEESATGPEQVSERDTEPAPIPRPAPSFHRPGPFSALRRVPQPPAPPPPQQSASNETADDSDSESELPPYSRNAPRQPGLPTYTARDQSEQRERAPAPVSPGLQQVMTSRGGIPMSDVSQRSIRDMDFNDAGSLSHSGEPRTIINVHHYYNGEHPRDAPEPPRPVGNQFVSEADLQSRNENEARRQRLEKEDNIAKKVGGFWRGRGCIPKKGCFGRGGREGRVRRRWYAAIIAFCIVVIVLSISLATTLTRKGDSMSVDSEWVNITGFPPIPTGIMTVAGPAPAVERSSCIAPTQVWSCALPPEQQTSNAGGYAADAPNFRIEIRFRNDSSVLSNSTATNSTTKRSWSGLYRRDNWDASPAAPRLTDQIFLGNTTDNITTPFQGEDTPFYITFLSPVDVANTTAEYAKRDVVSSTATGTVASTGTAATHVSATGTGTGSVTGSTGTTTSIKTSTGTSTGTSTSSASVNVENLIPAPDLASDGTAAAATLYPLPVQQPIKLYNRGLPTEHYGFFTYFDKSIFLASDASIAGGTTDSDSRDVNGGSSEIEASVRCTWSQTRFLVQIWTQPQNVTHMTLSALSNTTAASSAASATSTSKSSSSLASSSANNFTSPGSFPYPITITIDRHGGLATEKLSYCYGLEQHNTSSSGTYYNLTSPKLQNEQRSSGGTIVQPSPDYFVLAAAIAEGVTADEENPVDGGTGGCMCEWRNWIETH